MKESTARASRHTAADMKEPLMRKIIAMLILLVYMAFAIFVFATLGSWMTDLHGLIQMAFYILAGVLWILPIRQLFRWMNADMPPEED